MCSRGCPWPCAPARRATDHAVRVFREAHAPATGDLPSERRHQRRCRWRAPRRFALSSGELARALETGARAAATEAATQRLASGLARALDLPPVCVKVLAARPHARWGELHGLYETTRRAADPPLITLWMRTARQKRVVAFRTFLRTLLHEIGHHVDYTRAGARRLVPHAGLLSALESHLFHQLVMDGGTRRWETPDEQMARMARTADDLAAATARDAVIILA